MWDGKLECSTDECPIDATHVVWSENCGPMVWCADCAAEFGKPPLGGKRWHIEKLPDFAALQRDSEQLGRVREIVERWQNHVGFENSTGTMANLARLLEI